MKGAGVASAIVFMLLVSMIRLGDKSTFATERAEEDWVKQTADNVKAANKAGKKDFKRPERR